MLKKSSSSTTAGRAWRPGSWSRPRARPRLARGELDVLQAERGARPHEQRRVGRDRLDALVELHRDLRVGAAVGALPRLDLRDEAHARAADADLEALHELGGVRQVRLQVVGRHERQAGVRVVERKTATIVTSTVTAPTSTGLAVSAAWPRRLTGRHSRGGSRAPASAPSSAGDGRCSRPLRSASRFCSRRRSDARVAGPGRAGPGAACRSGATLPRSRRLAARVARRRRAASSDVEPPRPLGS